VEGLFFKTFNAQKSCSTITEGGVAGQSSHWSTANTVLAALPIEDHSIMRTATRRNSVLRGNK